MKKFRILIDKHKGKKAIILGCGASAKEILSEELPGNIITIGVNDIPSIYTPNYLLVVDRPDKFKGKRRSLVYNNESTGFLTQIKEWKIKNMDRRIIFELGSRRLKFLDKHRFPDKIDYSNNSPFMGVILAYKMGCTQIGLLGVDFTPDHFYQKDGEHILIKNNKFDAVQKDYNLLYNELLSKRVKIYNLSSGSKLKTIPKITLNKFTQNK